MKRKRRTEITLQAEESVAIRNDRILTVHCRDCRNEVRMIAANEAALIAGFRAREIYRFVETGRLHFSENQNGLLFVCLPSLHQLVSEVDPTQCRDIGSIQVS